MRVDCWGQDICYVPATALDGTRFANCAMLFGFCHSEGQRVSQDDFHCHLYEGDDDMSFHTQQRKFP